MKSNVFKKSFKKRVSLKLSPEKIKNTESFFRKIQNRESKNNRGFYIDPEILTLISLFKEQILSLLNQEFLISGFSLKNNFSHEELFKEAEEKCFKKIYTFSEAFVVGLCLMVKSVCDDAQTNINIYFDVEGVVNCLNIYRQKLETRLEFLVSKIDPKHRNEKFCCIVF